MADEAKDMRLLCQSVYGLNAAFGRLYQRLLGDLGLTYPQYLALRALRSGPQSVGDLATALGVGQNTVSPLLQRMEKARLVFRARSRRDERRVEVALTAAGVATAEKAEAVPRKVLEALGIKADEAADLTRRLDNLTAALTAR